MEKGNASKAFISAGSNIAPYENIPRAIELLKKDVFISGLSMFYKTPAVGGPPQPDFLNGVMEIRTSLQPHPLKALLHGIEVSLGRIRTMERFAPRTIDLDLLLYDDAVLKDSGLVLPHPDIFSRPFVAFPLEELGESLVIPGQKASIAEITKNFSRAGMLPDEKFTARLRKALKQKTGL